MIAKILIFLLSSALMLAAPIRGSAEYTEKESDVPDKMLFLGDSIASGFGLEGYDNDRYGCDSYANILGREYSEQLPEGGSFKLDNLAIDGQTSGELLDGLSQGEYDGYLADADCVVVSIGGNDMLGVLIRVLADSGINADGKTDAEFDFSELVKHIMQMNANLEKNLSEFDSNITRIAQIIYEKTDGRLIVQNLYDPLESVDEIPALQQLAQEKIDSLNHMITDHSGEGGYSVCDVAAAFEGKNSELTRISQFDIHPNEEGHKTIAKTLDEVIRQEKYLCTVLVPEETVPAAADEVSGNLSSRRSAGTALAAFACISALFLVLLVRMIIRIFTRRKM